MSKKSAQLSGPCWNQKINVKADRSILDTVHEVIQAAESYSGSAEQFAEIDEFEESIEFSIKSVIFASRAAVIAVTGDKAAGNSNLYAQVESLLVRPGLLKNEVLETLAVIGKYEGDRKYTGADTAAKTASKLCVLACRR